MATNVGVKETKNVNYESFVDFQYVIEKVKPAPICFGSGESRKLILSSYKQNNDIGPAAYDGVSKYEKIRSKRGIPGLASTVKRVMVDSPALITPDPCKYSVVKTVEPKEGYVPFNVGSKRLKYRINSNPGPGTYKVTKPRCKRTRVDYNFGHPCVVPAVETICINYPNKKCEKCGDPFEYGDFWHKNYQDYLCTLCMDEEHYLHELYTEKELCLFKKIRTCTFMHRHEGTSAAIRLMSNRNLIKRQRIENYLSLFGKCYCSSELTRN